MDGIEDGTLVAVPQPADGISLAPKITVEDGQVDWAAPALRVDRLVRGCTPAPGAWTVLQRRTPQADPGRARAPDRADPRWPPASWPSSKNAVHVGTGSHPVELTDVQPQGKKPMRGGGLGPRGADRLR